MRKHLQFTAIAFGGFVFIGGALAFQVNPPPDPQPVPKCRITQSGSKCGTDIVYSHETCGSQQCNTDEVIYDNILLCKRDQDGFEACESVDCNSHHITRECQNGSACVLIGEETDKAATGQRASGAACGSGSQ